MVEEKVCIIPNQKLLWRLGKQMENNVGFGGVVQLILLLPVTGTLKGYDALMNLVLDDVQEVLRGKFVF
jgi:hypothetical protein